MPDPELDVLFLAWTGGFRTKSNVAREAADTIAAAASDGLITVRLTPGTTGRSWLITQAGLQRLQEKLHEHRM